MLEESRKWDRVLVIGGAGFIGSHIVDFLMRNGKSVTVFDNLSNGNLKWADKYLEDSSKFSFIQGDIYNREDIINAMPQHDLVWHLGANADIPLGAKDTSLDLKNNVISMCNVLEAMRISNVKNIMFMSTSAVYGEQAAQPFSESSGPLLPVSLYGAGKVAGEAFISSYAYMFGLRAWIFRLGNVLGGRMNRGVIRDFIIRLKNDSSKLEVLGDGTQAKNFILVEEVIEGMLFAYERAELSTTKPVECFNLGTSNTASLSVIINTVLKELGLENTPVSYQGTSRSWVGDQPRVELDVSKMKSLGWEASHTSEEAIQIATRRMIDFLQ